MKKTIYKGNRKYMVKFICFVLQLTILFTSFIYTNSASYNTNTFSIKNFKITSKDSSTIQGTFTLLNNSSDVYPELWYSTQLFCSFEPGKSNLINWEYTPVSLTKLESQIITFIHPVPEKIPSADYNIVLRIYNRTGAILAIGFNSLGKMGSGSDFLHIYIEKTYYPNQATNKEPLSGPTFKQGEKPVLRTTVKNMSNSQINSKVKIATYKRNITYESKSISNIISDKVFTFAPNEEKIIDINLPTFTSPESYYFNIDFVDANVTKTSGIMEARYVLAGISAKIIETTANYKDGKLTINQTISGSADRTPITNAISYIDVYDEDANLLYSDQKALETINASISVSYEKTIDINNTSLEIIHTVKSGGTVLDTVTQNYLVEDISYQPTGTSPPPTIVTPKPTSTKVPGTPRPKPTFDPNQTVVLKDVVDTPYEESVTYLVQNGVIRGYGDNTFRPYNKITRSEFVTAILKFLNKGVEVDKSKVRNNFSDVSIKHWAYANINTAYEQNILKGYPDGTFKPDLNVSFAEAITVCINTLPISENKQNFKNWPADYLRTAQNISLDKGLNYSPNTPNLPANRGEVAKLIYNLENYMNGSL
jgi:hypothetical protein